VRLGRLLSFYFCFWFPFVMWPPMVAGIFVMKTDPNNFKDGGDEILFSCCFATGVESFFFLIGMMAVYNKLPLFPTLQALAGFGATLFFVPFGLLHFTFVVGCIFNAAIRIPSCSFDECTSSWVSFSGWCMFGFFALCQVTIVGFYFVSMHQNGSIKGFIESVAAIFEKETVEPVQDKAVKDEGTSTGDSVRFQNPVHGEGEGEGDGGGTALRNYASAGVAGMLVAHEMIAASSSFGD
jgi:hypothetical protein